MLMSGTPGDLLPAARNALRGGASEVAVSLPVCKGLIDLRLNLTQEHFSRILHELAAATLIRADGLQVLIRDIGHPRLMVTG